MKNRFKIAGALMVALSMPLPAQEGISRTQADAILSELRQIRMLLEKPAAPRQLETAAPEAPVKARIKLEPDRKLGDDKAPLTMVQYTDYQCPFCQRFHDSIFPEIKKNYIDTGKLRFYTRDLPLEFHAHSLVAAEAVHCAGDQGGFWTMHDTLSANPNKLGADDLASYAKDLKLDGAAFRSCLDSHKYLKIVQEDARAAGALGANGTPSFVVGRSTAEGVDGELVVGALPYAQFDQKLKEMAGTLR